MTYCMMTLPTYLQTIMVSLALVTTVMVKVMTLVINLVCNGQ